MILNFLSVGLPHAPSAKTDSLPPRTYETRQDKTRQDKRILIYYFSSLVALSIVGESEAATTIYSEDFTSASLNPSTNPYLGGWFTSSQASFQAWHGSVETSITTGALTVVPTNSIRSAGILLSPDLFPEAGSYTLSFDVTGFIGASNNYGAVTIWLGSGYDLSPATGNALILDTLAMELKAAGGATVSSQGSMSITASGDGMSIPFIYDGSSAVALFFGASTTGWPFPSVTYDNISISQITADAVPEPSVTILVALFASASCMIRRRV